MGYEVKIYIVRKHRKIPMDTEGKCYASAIAMFDLHKWGPLTEFDIERLPITDCCIYADDGDTEIIEDKYGDPIKEISVKELLELLRIDQTSSKCIEGRLIEAALIQLMVYPDEANNIVCLPYAY